MELYKKRGIVVEIGKEEKKSDKLKIQMLVIRTADEYPQYIVFEAANTKCDLLKSLFVNEIVVVHFEMKGKPWVKPDGTTKYFQSNSLYKIEFDEIHDNHGATEQEMKDMGFDKPSEVQQKIPKPHNNRVDDLPF